MRGLFIDEGKVRYRSDLPTPEPGEGETRVRVAKTGVCATDLALEQGYMGFRGVPGHEFVGTALDGPLVGQRVVGEINAACGVCPACRRGDDRHCPTRTVLGILNRGGAFAEELTLPHQNLRAVPDAVSDEAATLAEPLAAAFQIPAQVDVEGARALVIGDGRLGLLCAWALHLSGASVTVAGRHEERAALMPEGTGLAGPVAPGPYEGERYDLVVEVTGKGEILEAAVARTRPQGTLVLKTTAAQAAPLNLWQVVVDEIRVVGSRCGRFEPALEALASGLIPVDGLIAATYPLKEGEAAFAKAAEPGVLKVLVEVEESP